MQPIYHLQWPLFSVINLSKEKAEYNFFFSLFMLLKCLKSVRPLLSFTQMESNSGIIFLSAVHD